MSSRTIAEKVSNNKQAEDVEVSTHIDRRVQRTRQLLQEAMFSLISEQGYESIAIQDITERANLGRTTFYLHYRDKEELLRASVKALLQELQFDVEPQAEEVCSYQVRCIRIFRHVEERQQLYKKLLKETGPVNMGSLLQTYFTELFQHYTSMQLCANILAGTMSEIVAAHAAGALLGLISWWLNLTENAPSAESMGEIYFQLVAKGSSDLNPVIIAG